MSYRRLLRFQRLSKAVSINALCQGTLAILRRAILLAICALFAAVPANAQDGLDCVKQGSPCHVDSRLGMVGTDKPSVLAFLSAAKAAVQKNDRPALAKLITYPLRVNSNKKTVMYKSPAALLAAFDSVFTPVVLRVIEQAEYEGLFVRMDHGIMLGQGEIWCGAVAGAVLIKTVNVPPLF